MVARKTNTMIRAYVQNSHLLRRHGQSFRAYLQSRTPGGTFPPPDVTHVEKAWAQALMNDFYAAGPALAPYMICDWLLWLWREGRIEWFESYKPDSVHERAVAAGHLPAQAARNFAAYRRSLPDTVRPGSAERQVLPAAAAQRVHLARRQQVIKSRPGRRPDSGGVVPSWDGVDGLFVSPGAV